MAKNDFDPSYESFEQMRPVVIVVDSSEGVSEYSAEEIKNAMRQLYDDVVQDETSSARLEFAVILYTDDYWTLSRDFALLSDTDVVRRSERNKGSMCEAVAAAIELIEARKAWYRDAGRAYYRPWLVCIQGCGSNDNCDAVERLASRIREDVSRHRYTFLPVYAMAEPSDACKRLQGFLPPLPIRDFNATSIVRWFYIDDDSVI